MLNAFRQSVLWPHFAKVLRFARARPILSLVAGVAFPAVLLVVIVGVSLGDLRDRAIGDAEREQQNIAFVIAEETDRALQAVDLLQTALIEHMQGLGISTGEEYKRRMSGRDTHQMLGEKIAALRHVGSLSMIDADGKLINSSRSWPAAQVDISDRAYFKALKSDPHKNSLISEPVVDRASGKWTIYLARKFNGPDGQFVGLLVAAMQTEYFEDFFRKVAFGSDGSIGMFRGDGVLLARWPHFEGSIGKTYPDAVSVGDWDRRAHHTVNRATGVIDLKERLIAAADVPNYPISIHVTNTTGAILAGWWIEARNLLGLAAVPVLVICAIGAALARHLHRQNVRLDKLLSALKQREASFRLLFDGNPLPMWVYEHGTLRFLAVNAAAIKHYGYSREQFLAMTILDIRPMEDRNRVQGRANGAQARPGRVWRHIKADGAEISVAVFTRPLQHHGRAATLVAAIDVTERKRAWDEARRTRAFLDAIVDNIPETVFVKEPRELRYVLVNRAAEAMLGLPRSGILGKNAHDLFSPDEAGVFMANDRRVLEGGDQVVYDAHPVSPRNGDERIVTSTKVAVRIRSGEPEYLLTVVHDVTERERAQQRLRQAATVFANTHEGVVITDPRGRILTVNRAFTAITGYTEAELIGQNPRILKSGRQDDEFYQQMWSFIAQHDFWQGEVWNRRKNGEVYPELLTISGVRNEAGELLNYIGTFTDISDLKQSELRLQRMAHYDALTDLPNRLLLLAQLQEAITQAKRSGGQGAVLLLDLDRFKNVNDSLGHPAGDELLILVARRLRSRICDPDTLARMGGDEFVVLLHQMEPHDAAQMGQDLIDQFREPFVLADGHEVYIGASVGICLFPHDGEVASELVQHADSALYQAKDGGRNTYRLYSAALTRAASARLKIEVDLRRAFERNEFVLHYQPLISLTTGRIIGAEALIRWQDPEKGLIAPGAFIPVAEETGLIIPLGDWVLRAACAQMKAWLNAGVPIETMAVNLSTRQFDHPGLDDRIRAILHETGLRPEHLELELTESALMEQGVDVTNRLNALKALGVRLAIDDFGTGYSSLSYLARFPIDKLKIDQSFVRNIPDDRASTEITATIIALAKNLGVKVVAEGLETDAQLDFVRGNGCDTAQGYLFSRPLPTDEFSTFLNLFCGHKGALRKSA